MRARGRQEVSFVYFDERLFQFQFQFQWCEAGRQESSMTKPFRYLLPDRAGSR